MKFWCWVIWLFFIYLLQQLDSSFFKSTVYWIYYWSMIMAGGSACIGSFRSRGGWMNPFLWRSFWYCPWIKLEVVELGETIFNIGSILICVLNQIYYRTCFVMYWNFSMTGQALLFVDCTRWISCQPNYVYFLHTIGTWNSPFSWPAPVE